jgi:Ca-activated chloride channel homolog
MLRFAHQHYLYFLIVVPLLLLVFLLLNRYKKNLLKKFASLKLLEELTASSSSYKYWTKIGLILLTITFLIIALANPRIGTRYEEVQREGVDIIIALDVSLSMKAEDLKPSRLEKAKHEISSLISRLKGDRIGLVLFAGESYVQLPLTIDYSAAQMLIDIIDVESAPTPGTAIGSAIAMAMKSFPNEEVQKSDKVLIIITDGETFDQQTPAAAEEAAKSGVRIYTIGLGSPTGAPIPIYNKQGQQTDFKRDLDGNIVLTKLDETILERIASISSGKYYRASNNEDELDLIYKEIQQLEKKEQGTKQFTQFEDRFQYLIALGLLCLGIEFFISEKKWKWFSKFNIFRIKKS